MNLKTLRMLDTFCGYGTAEKIIDRAVFSMMDKQDFSHRHSKRGTDTVMRNTAKHFKRAMKRVFKRAEPTKEQYLDFALLYFGES